MNYRETLVINDKNHLEIGGVDTIDLVETYGTPLYVMDEAYIRNVCTAFKETIAKEYGEGTVAFASKAFSCMGIYKIIDSEGIFADVVSGGEIYTALKAGFPAQKMYFHGNNKLISELTYAIDNGIGAIVVDNLEEIEIVAKLAESRKVLQKILLRLNTGVEAHTHNFIQTSKPDSKFGFSIANGDAEIAVIKSLKYDNINIAGFHSHIGSQIFDKKAFVLAVDKLADFMQLIRDKYNFITNEINMGGGFGVWYTDDDPQFSIEDYAYYVKNISNALISAVKLRGINTPHLVIEPGRSIVGEAGITLYKVGAIKNIEGLRKYISIDGGMGDNPRYALYQAKYSVILANRANDAATEKVTVAGKCCESGDMIAVDVMLPEAKRNDIVAVFTTGAYNYSMSSNYNRNPVPPVVLVCNGKSDYLVRPQSYEDITRNDFIPSWLNDSKESK